MSILYWLSLLVVVIGLFKLLGLLVSDTINKSITGTVLFGVLSAFSILILSGIGFIYLWNLK
jgi:hypothetical protein